MSEQSAISLESQRPYQPTLHLHIACHPASAMGATLTDRLEQIVGHDPTSPFQRDIGIPLFRHAHPATDSPLPRSIDWASAEQHFVLLLIDDELMFDSAWVDYANRLVEQTRDDPQRHLLPIGLVQDAHNLFADPNLLVSYCLAESDERRLTLVRRTLVQELCRYLGSEPSESGLAPRPVGLFISHTKRSVHSEYLAREFKQVVEENPLGRFFDAVSIAPGSSLTPEIRAGLARSAVVLIRTDDYAASPWCQLEVIEAKRMRRPMVIIDALSEHEARLLPDMGNIPSTHLAWSEGMSDEALRDALEQNLDRVMEAVLGYLYAERKLRHWLAQNTRMVTASGYRPDEADTTLLYRPPEASDLVEALAESRSADAPPRLLLYPDPPLAEVEQARFPLHPRLRIATPLTLPGPLLAGRTLALSISGGEDDASRDDLARCGFTPAYLRSVLFEFSRHTLAHGATPAYGGDLREGGFTEDLFEYLHACEAAGHGRGAKARNYLAWPLHMNIDRTWWKRHLQVADLRRIAPPDDLLDAALDPTQKVEPDSPEHRYLWSRCLTTMRQSMASECDARVVVCGKWQGYHGRYPGILEEALLTLEVGKPLYLLGGFGGVTARIVELVEGGNPEILTEAWQRQDTDYAQMVDHYRLQASALPDLIPPIDYPALIEQLHALGPGGLDNGLSETENRLLMHTRDHEQAMALVFEGLRNKFGADGNE